MKNKIIFFVVIIVLIIAGVVFLFLKGNSTKQQEVSTYDPIDIVLDFYEPWLSARKSTSTDPYKEGLYNEPLLSKELRDRISSSEGQTDSEVDPVLCQTVVPTRISGKTLYKFEDKSQILVLARDEGLTGQAVVTLNRHNNGWYIDDIKCSPGEFAPPREFSFEREGDLIKMLETPPTNYYGYLVFEENEKIAVAPLFFNNESICIFSNGDESVCNTGDFPEKPKVTVYGEMSESGVTVKKFKFME